MKIFLDHCVPKRLLYLLTDEHEVRTAQQMNWAAKKNGALLSFVEINFDVFLTVDRNLKYRQNLKGRRLRIIILAAANNRYENARAFDLESEGSASACRPR